MRDDRIINFLRQNGPALPVEIGKVLGYNSLLTNAVLADLVASGDIKKSIRTIGSSLVYYLPGQEESMRTRLFNDLSIPEKILLKKIKEAGAVIENQLTAHDRQFIDRVKDFIKLIRNDKGTFITYYSYSNSAPEEVPDQIKVPEVITIERKVETNNDFESLITNKINELGEVTSNKTIVKGREYDCTVKIKNFLGDQEFFIKAKNKQKINEHDLSMIYTQALKQKKPAILITNGSLTKKAEKWAKENTGELLKVIRL